MTTVYSAKDSSRFFLHRAVWKRFSHGFSEIKAVEDFYPWANRTLLPNLYGDYRGKDSSGAEGRQVSPPETLSTAHGKLKVSQLLEMATALWTMQSPGTPPKKVQVGNPWCLIPLVQATGMSSVSLTAQSSCEDPGPQPHTVLGLDLIKNGLYVTLYPTFLCAGPA